VNITEQGRYLDRILDVYLDAKLVDSLLSSEDLKGRVTTQVAVSGSGFGKTQQEAFNSAKENMNKLQTILITGSLPYKLEIVKLDTISPLLGKKFINYLLLAGFSSLVAVALIVFIRYRRIKPSLAILLTSFSEVIIILGFASLIKWNLDLASIAGILVVIGTGVDQQIIMIDESRTGVSLGVVEKIKRALFIIVGAYFTSLAALIPLYWAGAGLLRGFAVTTIIGITAGVLITRPAFAEILKKLET
jgi:preprotein translocase subunit SecD